MIELLIILCFTFFAFWTQSADFFPLKFHRAQFCLYGHWGPYTDPKMYLHKVTTLIVLYGSCLWNWIQVNYFSLDYLYSMFPPANHQVTPKVLPILSSLKRVAPFLNSQVLGLWRAKAASPLLSSIKGINVVSEPITSSSENKLWKLDECEPTWQPPVHSHVLHLIWFSFSLIEK